MTLGLPYRRGVFGQTVARAIPVVGEAGLRPARAAWACETAREEEGGNAGETWFPPRERGGAER
jgi:hypothetical protein